ncbi:hypothetical protein GCM10027416_06100 [Okibacterium endophyticum]
MTPRFSVVTPVYNTPIDALTSMIESVIGQSFTDWELVLVDDASPRKAVPAKLREIAAQDARLTIVELEENRGIVGASNAGLAVARGEFIALVDHDDLLHPRALEFVSAAIDDEPHVDYLYTDEDKVNENGEHYDEFRKPEWSPERLRGHMYVGHLSVLRRSVVETVGGFRHECEGSQDHDLVLRVTERARRIVHVPEVLYHWKAIQGSAAADENAKPYAWDAGVRAVHEHMERVGIPGVASRGRAPSHYNVDRTPDTTTPVSVVIPTRGSTGTIGGEERVFVVSAVKSVLERTSHSDLEFVVVHDSETPPRVLDELSALPTRVKLVPYEEPFNFSRKCNVGFLEARGEVVVFLNDDVEAVSHGVIENLIAPLREPDVGMTGARLNFEDGTLQHGGHRYGGGDFIHAYLHASPDYPGEFSTLFVNREVAGLTAACVAVRRETFEQAGGFTELLPLNYNDVDFSLKLRSQGYRLIWLHNVELFHFESKTRVNQIEAYERAIVRKRWGTPLRDPYLP